MDHSRHPLALPRPAKTSKLVIFGNEDFADIAFEYFSADSAYEVSGFTLDAAYIRQERKFGLPVVPFEKLEEVFSPSRHAFFAAVVYGDLNRVRQRAAEQAKQRGYPLASYVSSRAFVWPNARLGEHCFIFENNSVQPFSAIGDNTVLWCGNQVSHHARVGSHCFLSGSVGLGGWSIVEDHCFLGINSTLANNGRIGAGSWISHGACLSGEVPAHSFVPAGASKAVPLEPARLQHALGRAREARLRAAAIPGAPGHI